MKKYHKDYVLEAAPEEDGKEEKKYRYIGDYYVFSMDVDKKKKIFIKNAAFAILYFLLIFLSGLLNNDGSRNFFIAIPYAFLFLPAVYLLISTFSVLKMEQKMERVVYDKALGRMYRSCIGIMVISLYLCITDSVFLLTNVNKERQLQIVREVVFLFANIGILCFSFLQKKYLQNLKKKVMICKYNNEVP